VPIAAAVQKTADAPEHHADRKRRRERVLELGIGNHKPLDRSKVKVESDRAIKAALSAPLLKPLKVTATQLWLQHGDLGPEWKVRLWAAKLRNPTEDADIGEVYIASDSGEVIRTDLHVNSVD
jgi:hypothetical protein